MILWNVTVVLVISLINKAELWYRNELTSKCQQCNRPEWGECAFNAAVSRSRRMVSRRYTAIFYRKRMRQSRISFVCHRIGWQLLFAEWCSDKLMANFPWCHLYPFPSCLCTTAAATKPRGKVSRLLNVVSPGVSRQTTQRFPFINCSEMEIVVDWKYFIGFVGTGTLYSFDCHWSAQHLMNLPSTNGSGLCFLS